MDNLTDHRRIGGESVTISDCWVWAVIHYLDSPTNYREYLPQNGTRPRNIPGNDVVMLESHASLQSPKARRWSPWLVLLFILMSSWLLLRLLDVW
jgi:hypothetical protein